MVQRKERTDKFNYNRYYKKKSNLYFSNLGFDHVLNEQEESKENKIDEDPFQLDKLKVRRNKNKIDIDYKKPVNKILKEYPNKYFKESLDKINYKINKENAEESNNNIDNTSKIPLKGKISNLSLQNYNQKGKYIVPYSLEKSNYIKQLEQYQEENADGKNKKKKAMPKSAAKIKKGKKKAEPTLINVIASIAQEKFDNDDSFIAKSTLYKDFLVHLSSKQQMKIIPIHERDETDEEYNLRVTETIEKQFRILFLTRAKK